jgi:hypothetical protein
VLIVLKSGSLNLLEHSGPVKGCNGIVYTYLYLYWTIMSLHPAAQFEVKMGRATNCKYIESLLKLRKVTAVCVQPCVELCSGNLWAERVFGVRKVCGGRPEDPIICQTLLIFSARWVLKLKGKNIVVNVLLFYVKTLKMWNSR